MTANSTRARDMTHVWRLLGVLVVGAVLFNAARMVLVPDTFGDDGPYRAAALGELGDAKAATIPPDSRCLACHEDVGEERSGAAHEAVRCYHCHGLATQHVAEATAAADKPDVKLTPAAAWDLDFDTEQDLYNTKHRKACLVCHEKVIGMPKDFQQIVVDAHLKEEEPENPQDPAVCAECHEGHDTAP